MSSEVTPRLEQLVDGRDVRAFVHDAWERSVSIAPDALADAAGLGLSLEQFETGLASLYRPQDGWLHLANGGRAALPDTLIDDAGLLRMDRLRREYAKGQSLYLTKADRLFPTLARWCDAVQRGLQREGVRLRSAVNAHLFLTPPNARAFQTHRDEHASFVVQFEGRKEWTVFAPPQSEDPLWACPRTGAVSDDQLGACTRQDITLSAGDVLFMPAWWPHHATTAERHSLHTTLRMFPLRGIDVLRAVVDDIGALATALPTHGSTEGLCALIEGALATGGAAIRQHLDAHEVPDPAMPAGGLRAVSQTTDLSLDSAITRRGTLPLFLDVSDDAVQLRAAHDVVRGPRVIEPVFRFIVKHTVFRARDLPALDVDYDRLAIVQNLVRNGVLVPAERS